MSTTTVIIVTVLAFTYNCSRRIGDLEKIHFQKLAAEKDKTEEDQDKGANFKA